MHCARALVIILAFTGTASAQAVRQDVTAPEPSTSLDPLPASFVGVLPCVDCPGVFYQLNLFADRVFFLRMGYADREASIDDVGRWALSSDGGVVMLKGARDVPLMFAIQDRDTLRLLNADGDPIAATANYELRRSTGLELFEPRLNVSGMYRYEADAGIFTECATGRRLVVADEDENDALESAYEDIRQQPGEEVKVLVNARFVVHPGFDYGVVQLALVVERFTRFLPGEHCGLPFSALPIENTYWRATQLEGQPLPTVDPGGQAYLIFEEGGRVSGADGCNRVAGRYELNRDAIRFGPMASTRVACVDSGGTHRAFGYALTVASRWRILGDRLELFDSRGARLARFEPGISPSR
jgi:copper homeostasis protein (lipoprotein)